MALTDRRAGTALLAVVLATGGGCESGPKVSYAPVEGTVTLGGKPLAGADVTFYPVSDTNTALPAATARTDAAGKYRLAAADGGNGAVVGKNRVVVTWPPRERTDDRDKAPPPRPTATIPTRYTVAGQTPLVVEVKAGDAQTLDLKLDAH